MKRVFLETYGCQMNVADSEVMAGVLERAGMELVSRPDEADAVILNTCAIRASRPSRSRRRFRCARRISEKAGNVGDRDP